MHCTSDTQLIVSWSPGEIYPRYPPALHTCYDTQPTPSSTPCSLPSAHRSLPLGTGHHPVRADASFHPLDLRMDFPIWRLGVGVRDAGDNGRRISGAEQVVRRGLQILKGIGIEVLMLRLDVSNAIFLARKALEMALAIGLRAAE